MKSSVEKQGQLGRKLNVEVPASVVADAYDKVFKDVQKKANLKGFRQGKAPITLIKSTYGSQVTQDVVQDIIQSNYSQALKEHKLEPISYPEFEFLPPLEGKDFSFSAIFEIRPEVTLKKIDGLEFKKEKLDVSDEKIMEVIKNIQSTRAKLEDVKESRAAKMGDVAVMDFVGRMNGELLEQGSGEGFELELGAKQFIDGFEDGLVGMTAGQEKTLNLKFPVEYHVATLAGQPVEFKVTLKGLKTKVLPTLDDEFVAGVMGQMPTAGEPSKHTVESLKKTIKEDLEQTDSKRIETDLKNTILKTLVKNNPVDVPNALMVEQKQSLVEDMKKRMTEQGLSDKDFQAYVEKWDGDFTTTAAEMIQSGFIVETIAETKDLRCKKEDLDKKFAEYAKQTGIEETRIREFYSKPEQMNRLAYSITEEKVIAYIMSSAKIKEVDASELKK